MKDIDYLAKLLPVASIYLILCSAIRLSIYYHMFNISIIDYLNIGEYPTLFIDDILNYLSIFGAGVVIEILNPYNKENIKNNLNFEQPHFKEKRKKLMLIFFALVTLISLLFCLFYYEPIAQLNIFKVGFFLLLINFHLYCQYTKINFTSIGLFSSVILCYTIIDAKIDAIKVLANQNDLQYLIKVENTVVKTDEKLLYLGKSEKFVFLYDKTENKSTILFVDQIKIIQIKSKNGR